MNDRSQTLPSKKYGCAAVGAILLGLCHIVIALPSLNGSATGEAAVYMFFVDLPLSLLPAVLPGGLYGQSQTFWKFYVGIFGTAMYGAGGAVCGYLVDRIRSKFSC